ncbi:MAG: hypothetical protein ACXW3P_09560, partial [Rhodospirillales bacterium]
MDAKQGIVSADRPLATNHFDLLDRLLSKSVSAGADAVDAVFALHRSLSVSYRLGSPENLERSESK